MFTSQEQTPVCSCLIMAYWIYYMYLCSESADCDAADLRGGGGVRLPADWISHRQCQLSSQSEWHSMVTCQPPPTCASHCPPEPLGKLYKAMKLFYLTFVVLEAFIFADRNLRCLDCVDLSAVCVDTAQLSPLHALFQTHQDDFPVISHVC